MGDAKHGIHTHFELPIVKIKLGQETLEEDIERVAAVRELIGPQTVFMVDANMKWSIETAIKAAKLLQQYDVLWLEEPTIPDDYDGYKRISQEGGLAIAAGETSILFMNSKI
jgi:L-alanine-DL-glutamate epimerase-like enolase superfamily enzyme